MTTAPPRHGSEARYKGTRTLPPCRCPHCTRGNRHASIRREIARNTGQPSNLTPTEAAALLDHIRALRTSGMSQTLIARRAGIAQATISYFLLGKTKTCHRDKATRILAVQPGQFDDVAVRPALGSTRRVQALYVMGHDPRAIGAAAGLHPDTVSCIAHGRFRIVDGRTAAGVARAYDALRTVPGRSGWIRGRSRRAGWPGPLAWDGNFDDPQAVPDRGLVTGPSIPRWQALGEDADELVIRGRLSWESAAARLGVTVANLQRSHYRWRKRTTEPDGEAA